MSDETERPPFQQQIDVLRGRVTFAIDLEKRLLGLLESLIPGVAAQVHEGLAQDFSRKPDLEHAARGYKSELDRLGEAIQRRNPPTPES